MPSSVTDAQKLYYCVCIRANRSRYGWGRQANRSRKNILLPEPQEIPDWVEGAAAASFIGKEKPADASPTPPLDTTTWKLVRLSALFDLKKGKRLTKADRVPGGTPFVGALDRNNGLAGYTDRPPLHPAGTITVNYNGIGGVATAFYQPVAYWCSDDVNALYPRFDLTPAVALFIAAIIRREKYRFSFGRKWHLERMEQSEIRLPVRSDGEPDWEFMERYIKTLPFSSQI